MKKTYYWFALNEKLEIALRYWGKDYYGNDYYRILAGETVPFAIKSETIITDLFRGVAAKAVIVDGELPSEYKYFSMHCLPYMPREDSEAVELLAKLIDFHLGARICTCCGKETVKKTLFSRVCTGCGTEFKSSVTCGWYPY